ncbi:vacuolar membrane-associated protein iml1, partial [Rhizophlyctis rosea]
MTFQSTVLQQPHPNSSFFTPAGENTDPSDPIQLPSITSDHIPLKSSTILSGAFPPASSSNILEATNLALNLFDKHYIDRDLMRTGLTIVIVTAGSGIVDAPKDVWRCTEKRVVESGVSVDWVCLGRRGLNVGPLVRVLGGGASSRDEANPDGRKEGTKGVWRVPHWVECSFWDRAAANGGDGGFRSDGGGRSSKFVLRCKMYEVQMMGLMEQIGKEIDVPYLAVTDKEQEDAGEE